MKIREHQVTDDQIVMTQRLDSLPQDILSDSKELKPTDGGGNETQFKSFISTQVEQIQSRQSFKGQSMTNVHSGDAIKQINSISEFHRS